MKRWGGFTRVELLVVVAIVGIFSVIVLISLHNTHSKSNGAVTQSQQGYAIAINDMLIRNGLLAVQTQAKIYRRSAVAANSYGPSYALGACPVTVATSGAVTTTGRSMFATDSLISRAIAKTIEANEANEANGSGTVKCIAGGGININFSAKYAVQSSLGTGGYYWCIDSTGNAKGETSELTGTTCS